MAGPWEKYQAPAAGPWTKYSSLEAASVATADDSTPFNLRAAYDTYVDTTKNVTLGAVKGAANIGATILAPIDKLIGKTDRRQQIKDFFAQNADPESNAFRIAETGAEIAGTAGVGGTIAKGVRAAGRAVPLIANYAPKLAAAIESGGFALNTPRATTIAGKAADLGTRALGGAITGGAATGLVNPEDAGTGALIGGAMPVAVKAAGEAGKLLAPKAASPEVASLFKRAQELGIEIPADRLTNNRTLNAAAASLNYVPGSGRQATEEKMISQFNRAISRTFGQDTDNVTGALRKANIDLGTKFDRTLSQNGVKVDQAFLDDMVKSLEMATGELDDAGARIIGKQIDDLLAKTGPDGVIDGQTAYNIKKKLDRIGGRNSNEAWYATQLKKSLMGALDRSLGPKEAEAFKGLRQQYGNMLDIEGLAQRGAEGGVSIGKLANTRDLNNPDLSELADIAAQFLKVRESPHGAAQRVVLGTLGAGALGAGAATGTLPFVAGGMAAGRAANVALNSNMVKNALLGQAPNIGVNSLMIDPAVRTSIYQLIRPANP